MENFTQENFNFYILIEALKYSTFGLKTYVDQCIDNLYDRLRRNVCSKEACTTFCSKTYNVTKWCETCVKWKRETEKYMRFNSHKKKIPWQDIKLWKLSGKDCEEAKCELFRIFVRDAKIVYDIQTMLSLLQNCRYFDIGDDNKRLQEVREVRNVFFAHTCRFEISREELEKAIMILVHFFQHASLKGFRYTLTTVIDLKGLLKKDKERISEIEVFKVYENIKIVKQLSITNINDMLSITEDKIKTGGHPGKAFKLPFIISAVIFILAIIIMMISSNNITDGKLSFFYWIKLLSFCYICISKLVCCSLIYDTIMFNSYLTFHVYRYQCVDM